MRIAVTIAILITLAGCSAIGVGGGQSWKEQVALPDGRDLIVERSHILRNRFDREIAAFNSRPGAESYAVTVPFRGGHTAPWTAEHKDMIPLAVAADESAAYLVASPFNCRSYSALGRPVPPFAIFKYERDSWRRVEIVQLPTGISEANLLIDTSDSVVDSGFVTARTIRRLNEIIVRRHIYREGVDNYLWGACLRDLAEGRQ